MEHASQSPAPYPVQFTVSRPERSSRLLALATLIFLFPKIILVVPHILILYVLGLVSVVATVVAQIAVLITGQYPAGLFDMVAGIIRWQVRLNAYMFGLTDAYPPFRLHA
jgi:hypothetical protein